MGHLATYSIDMYFMFSTLARSQMCRGQAARQRGQANSEEHQDFIDRMRQCVCMQNVCYFAQGVSMQKLKHLCMRRCARTCVCVCVFVQCCVCVCLCLCVCVCAELWMLPVCTLNYTTGYVVVSVTSRSYSAQVQPVLRSTLSESHLTRSHSNPCKWFKTVF